MELASLSNFTRRRSRSGAVHAILRWHTALVLVQRPGGRSREVADPGLIPRLDPLAQYRVVRLAGTSSYILFSVRPARRHCRSAFADLAAMKLGIPHARGAPGAVPHHARGAEGPCVEVGLRVWIVENIARYGRMLVHELGSRFGTRVCGLTDAASVLPRHSSSSASRSVAKASRRSRSARSTASPMRRSMSSG